MDNMVLGFGEIIEDPLLLKALKENGYITPSSIQLKVLQLKEEEKVKDLVLQAKAGLGKTLAFLLHILLQLNYDDLSSIKALIIAPTREISHQIYSNLFNLLKIFKPAIKACNFVGGLDINLDKKQIKDCNIAIGTPGRIQAIIKLFPNRFNKIQFLCLDEADKLMERVFESQLNFIKDNLPKDINVIATSATFDEDKLNQLESRFLKEPTYIMVDGEDYQLEAINQYYIDLSPMVGDKSRFEQLEYKMEFIINLLKEATFYQSIIFLNSPTKCIQLVELLDENNWPCTYISGTLEQSKRMLAMDKTRNFDVRILVCSDLISRGIDIPRVDLIINLELPDKIETYLHRIGRTGRFNTTGLVVNLISNEGEMKNLNKLKENYKIKIQNLKGDELSTLTTQRQLESKDVLSFSKLRGYKGKRKEEIQLEYNTKDENKHKKEKKQDIKDFQCPSNSTPINQHKINNINMNYAYDDYYQQYYSQTDENNYNYNPLASFWYQHFYR